MLLALASFRQLGMLSRDENIRVLAADADRIFGKIGRGDFSGSRRHSLQLSGP